ncbi:hypothetical protein K435DRAFT_808613 [Dendrothele bispora CBS 962.96]|uniref:Uncharacterized protein n=1 Tax=Dendrothele bispora (strain CBS 962.96) TaxID=1314807 RepID=A0A4S8L0Z3_DENBC|nr:hypothetical protein K435DRAFT_808613 [Dendrothele bispora CBS 962.96]
MSLGPRTTWNDLAHLGVSRHRAYITLNPLRGGTMQDLNDALVNDSYTDNFGWFCYNSILDSPTLVSNSLVPNTTSEVSWSYDNTNNNQSHSETWTEEWEERESATVSITQRSSITLESTINLYNVASTSLSFSIDTEDNSTKSSESIRRMTRSWTMNVGPGERLSLIRNITRSTGTATYTNRYGLHPSHDIIGTKGRRWNNHFYWGYHAKDVFGPLTGSMRFEAHSTITSFTFTLDRVTADGRHTVEPLPLPSGSRMGGIIEGAIPGIDDKDPEEDDPEERQVRA